MLREQRRSTLAGGASFFTWKICCFASTKGKDGEKV